MSLKKWGELPWFNTNADDRFGGIVLWILNLTLVILSYFIAWFLAPSALIFCALAFAVTAGWIYILETSQETDEEQEPKKDELITWRKE